MVEACSRNSWGNLCVFKKREAETTWEEWVHRGDEQLVLNQAATMSLFDTGVPTHIHSRTHTQKPLASQQRWFELHTCLRSYSQLTLTQPRRGKKETRREKRASESSRPVFQLGRKRDGHKRGGGNLFWNVAYSFSSFLIFAIFSLLNTKIKKKNKIKIL